MAGEGRVVTRPAVRQSRGRRQGSDAAGGEAVTRPRFWALVACGCQQRAGGGYAAAWVRACRCGPLGDGGGGGGNLCGGCVRVPSACVSHALLDACQEAACGGGRLGRGDQLVGGGGGRGERRGEQCKVRPSEGRAGLSRLVTAGVSGRAAPPRSRCWWCWGRGLTGPPPAPPHPRRGAPAVVAADGVEARIYHHRRHGAPDTPGGGGAPRARVRRPWCGHADGGAGPAQRGE